MLQIFRDKAQSLVIQAIVVVIALVFIFWGVGANMNNKQEAAIVVNGEEISFQKFQQAYDQAYTRMAQQFGGTIPKGLAESLNIKQQVINQITQETLLRQGGFKMGLTVSGAEIQKEIDSMPQFQNNGSFDIERYQSILASNRLSPTKFENSMRYDLLSSKTVQNISDFVLSSSDYEIEDLYNMEKETVAVSYISISPDNYLKDIDVNDSDIEKWFQANGKKYQTEPMVKLTYLPYSYNDIGNKVTIDNTDITAYYDANLPNFQTPETRHARHILIKASPEQDDDFHAKQRSKAEEILKKVNNGGDFADLAREFSEGPTKTTGGDLGFFPKGSMIKSFDETVFSMEEGKTSAIVKTDFGYHIIKLEEVKLAGTKTLDQVRDTISTLLKLEQAKPLAFQVANGDYEKIIASGSLSAFLEQSPDTKVIKTKFFSRSAPPAGMTTDPSFLDRAFLLKQGELSSLVETNNGYAILSATALQEPQIPELSVVKEKVIADYKAQKAGEKAKETAEQLLDNLTKGDSSFENLAEAVGLTVKESGPLMKNNSEQESAFPQSLMQSAFKLSSSAKLPDEPGQVENDFYVYQFLKRTPPKESISEENRERYSQMLLQYKQQQVVDAWLKNQQASADVFISKSLENY